MRYTLLTIWAVLCALPLTANAQCERLSVTAITNYPPYSWHENSESGKNTLAGAFIEISLWLGKELNIGIEPLYSDTWARTQEEVSTGHIDLLAGVFFTKERTERYDYLFPELSTTESVVFINKAHPFDYQSMDDLKGKQGVTLINNSLGQAFDDRRDEFTLYEVARIEQAFKMLSQRRADYVAFEYLPSLNHIKKLKLNHIQALNPPISSERIYLAISKKSACNTPELRSKLEQALQKLHSEQLHKKFIAEAEEAWQAWINREAPQL